jgi:hypothetical protein
MTPSCHGTFAPAASAQRFCELLPQGGFLGEIDRRNVNSKFGALR